MTSVLAKRAEEQSAQVKQALTAETKADPQIGGANYAANLKSASRFMPSSSTLRLASSLSLSVLTVMQDSLKGVLPLSRRSVMTPS